MEYLKKYGPIVLYGVAAALAYAQPQLVKDYPQYSAAIIVLVGVLSHLAPKPIGK